MTQVPKNNLTFSARPGVKPSNKGGFYAVVWTKFGDDPEIELVGDYNWHYESDALLAAQMSAAYEVDRFKQQLGRVMEHLENPKPLPVVHLQPPYPKTTTLVQYIQLRADAGEFEMLVDELTTMLYTGFEAGGAQGNIPQLGSLIPDMPVYAVEHDWLVIANRQVLKNSITAILDSKL